MWMTLHIENRAVVFIHTMIDYLFFMFLRESLPTEPLVWGGFSCIYRRCIYSNNLCVWQQPFRQTMGRLVPLSFW